jgi:hypothetical protein
MAVNLELPDKWAPCLLRQGETGMGYQTASITRGSHYAVIHAFDDGGNVIETHEAAGEAGLSKRVRPDDALRQFGMRNGVRRLAWSPMCHGSPKEWG